MKKILIIEPLLEKVIIHYKQRWINKNYFIDYIADLQEAEISSVLSKGSYDVLIVRNKVISRDIIQNWSVAKENSKLAIVRAGSNISTIDVKAAVEFGVTIMNTPGANSQAVAQYIISQFFI